MGQTDLTHLEKLDLQSREEWLNSATVALIETLGVAGCQLVVSRGFNHFLPIAKQAWEGHAFKYDDFKRAYELVGQFGEGKVTIEAILTRGRR